MLTLDCIWENYYICESLLFLICPYPFKMITWMQLFSCKLPFNYINRVNILTMCKTQTRRKILTDPSMRKELLNWDYKQASSVLLFHFSDLRLLCLLSPLSCILTIFGMENEFRVLLLCLLHILISPVWKLRSSNLPKAVRLKARFNIPGQPCMPSDNLAGNQVIFWSILFQNTQLDVVICVPFERH